MRATKIIFWSNHLNININKILPRDIAQSLEVLETKTFDEVDEILSCGHNISAIITSLYTTDLQALCCIQKIQHQYPDIALIAVLDTVQQISSVYDTLRMLLGQLHQQNLGSGSIYAASCSNNVIEPSTVNLLDKKTIIDAKNTILDGINTKQNSLLSTPTKPIILHQNDKGDQDIHLTNRQQAVLSLLMRGKSNKEIARLLSISEGTIKIHCMAIYRELGVKNRTQAAMRAEQLLPQLTTLWGFEGSKGQATNISAA
jgi:DNA-binding NarL/FixJ family response regulator